MTQVPNERYHYRLAGLSAWAILEVAFSHVRSSGARFMSTVVAAACPCRGTSRGASVLIYLRLALVVLGSLVVAAARADSDDNIDKRADSQPTALVVSPINRPLVVPGSDGLMHLEYDLLVTNVFVAPVTLT